MDPRGILGSDFSYMFLRKSFKSFNAILLDVISILAVCLIWSELDFNCL